MTTRRETGVGEEAMKSQETPTNRTITETTNTLKSLTITTCEMCDDKDAVVSYRCEECDQFACETCARSHSRIKATRSHTLTPATSTGEPTLPQSKDLHCQVHAEEKLRFYCTKCNQVICRDCKLTSHEGHSTTDVSQKSLDARAVLQDILPILQNSLQPQLQKILDDAVKQKTEVKKQKQEIASTLRQRADLIKAEVDACLMKAEKDLFMESGDTELAVDQSVTEMTKQMSTLNDLTQRVERVLQSAGDAALLQLPKQAGDLVGAKHQVAVPPVTSASLFGGHTSFQPQFSFNTPFQPQSYGKLDAFTTDVWKTSLRLTGAETSSTHAGSFMFGSSPKPKYTGINIEGNANQQPFRVLDSLKTEITRCFGKVEKVLQVSPAPLGFFTRAMSASPRADETVGEVKIQIFNLQRKLQGWV
ncbi:transcription intermediary factor 1-alpha-like [Littorina saxatilis]|uniref:B box-type domain-containing protein n=1 Tax=Littorina saxatilis TaxID=31220 RepID=A0AAN9AZN3_9CAEN